MKISTWFLSFCGLSVFYLCYADWIDDLLEAIAEDYLGYDYEEVAPFIPSVGSSTTEFDSIVEQLSRTPKKDFGRSQLLAVALAALTVLLLLAGSITLKKYLPTFGEAISLAGSHPERKSTSDKGESTVSLFERKKTNKRFRWGVRGDEVPVQVIWKGNGFMESSVHCNLTDRVHGERKAERNDFGAGDVTGSESNQSTVRKLAEMRKMLESESEMTQKLMERSAGTEDFPENELGGTRGNAPSQPIRSLWKTAEEEEEKGGVSGFRPPPEETGNKEEKEFAADPKLMNRIRLLESRLRLEELKNRNWISRMSRAEGILQQLNKQVERIERSQPVETTLLETLKITSTVTKWMPVTQPGRNLGIAASKEHPRQPQCESLSEYIRREISLPCSHSEPKRFMSLPKSTLVKALPAAGLTPQPSILSKFLTK